MLLLLPLLTLIALCSILVLWGVVKGYRHAFLLAATLLGVAVILYIEILSRLHAIFPVFIQIFWVFLTLLSCGEVVRCFYMGKRMPGIFLLGAKGFRWELGLLIASLVLAAGTFLIGSVSALNNWDSMTYHLPRVMHWLQNHSLAYYPTNIVRQNSYLPGAEILLLHSFILGGGDRWVHCVQWLSFIGCAVGGSLIAQRLGAEMGGQVLAGVFALTLPAAILQSMTTQNDLVLSFWVMCVVFFIFDLKGRWSFWSVLGAGCACGLAAVTKGTFFILIPFIILGLIQSACVEKVQRVGLLILVMFLSVFLVSGGHAYREMMANKGSVSTESTGLLMSRRDFAAILSNISRNLASECALPSAEVNNGIGMLVVGVHRFLGISPVDPRTTAGSEFTLPNAKLVFHEDYAGSPVHVLWGIVMFVGVIFVCWSGRVSGFVLAWVGSVFLFVLMIKWQPWINRFHIPLFILAAPLIGLVAGKMRRSMAFFACGAIVYGIVVILCNVRHPFWGEINIFSDRQAQIFTERTHLARPYFLAAEGLQKMGCRDVGLIMGNDDWEYPLWALTRQENVVFRHMGVGGAVDIGSSPCVIINTLDPTGDKVKIWGGAPFVRVFGFPDLAVYVHARRE
ncbi:MAG: hypothetical protein HQL21_08710 [Candidatus Omnitrophica bacterium]|nr:hypothetical protein [Candidatus Omnitrophota bacterium]